MSQSVKHFLPLMLGVMTVFFMAIFVKIVRSPLVIYNSTDSIPIGFYWVSQVDSLAKGDIAVFRPTEEAKNIILARGWLPENGYLLKPIVALKGDLVCAENSEIYVNGEAFGKVNLTDSKGRSLPRYSDCENLKSEQAFVAIKDKENSFDSRYFGALNISQIEGVARPLWMF